MDRRRGDAPDDPAPKDCTIKRLLLLFPVIYGKKKNPLLSLQLFFCPPKWGFMGPAVLDAFRQMSASFFRQISVLQSTLGKVTSAPSAGMPRSYLEALAPPSQMVKCVTMRLLHPSPNTLGSLPQ